MQSVIYLFVSPSGRAYAGWHGIDHAKIPRRGTGPLPDKVRYTGSGKLWENVARKHGPDLRWIILQRFPEGTPRATTDAAEQRAIRLVRRLWADRCANIRDGGQGMTRRDALALWADPDYAERTGAAIREAFARPEVKAKVNAAANTPEALLKLTKSHKALAQTSHRREQLARATAASLTPEARLRRDAGQTEEVREKRRASLKAFAASPEGKEAHKRATGPAAQARRLLTRSVNEYRRFVAEHPELF
jgi:hypothetical protein